MQVAVRPPPQVSAWACDQRLEAVPERRRGTPRPCGQPLRVWRASARHHAEKIFDPVPQLAEQEFPFLLPSGDASVDILHREQQGRAVVVGMEQPVGAENLFCAGPGPESRVLTS